jgi:uncharacterized protein
MFARDDNRIADPMAAADRLSDAELDTLAAALASDRMPNAMPIDAAQGALYALASGPGEFPAAAALASLVFGDDAGHADAADAEPSRAALDALIERFAAQCRREVREAEDSLPLLLFDGDDGKPDYETWCLGYLDGIEASDSPWFEGDDAEPVYDLTQPIEALAADARADPSLFDGIEDLAAYRREAARNLVDTLIDIRDYWFDLRTSRVPARRDAPKVGRNDPCPCGSGRKFKQCHGRAS